MKPFLPTLRSRPTRGLSLGIAVLLALGTPPFQSITAHAAETGSTNAPNPLLTVERIFKGGEFGGEGFSGQWLDDSSGYVTWETPASGGPGKDLVRHDPATDQRDVLLAAAELIPAHKTQPLSVDDYAWSADRSKVLIYTQSKKVWRTHARGDYWVLDRTSHELFQLGGDAPASSLQFAKFSPDGTRVAYVRERNLYVQDLRSRKITPSPTRRTNTSSTGPSTGCTRRSSPCRTASAGARTAARSPSGSSTPRACAKSRW